MVPAVGILIVKEHSVEVICLTIVGDFLSKGPACRIGKMCHSGLVTSENGYDHLHTVIMQLLHHIALNDTCNGRGVPYLEPAFFLIIYYLCREQYDHIKQRQTALLKHE